MKDKRSSHIIFLLKQGKIALVNLINQLISIASNACYLRFTLAKYPEQTMFKKKKLYPKLQIDINICWIIISISIWILYCLYTSNYLYLLGLMASNYRLLLSYQTNKIQAFPSICVWLLQGLLFMFWIIYSIKTCISKLSLKCPKFGKMFLSMLENHANPLISALNSDAIQGNPLQGS